MKIQIAFLSALAGAVLAAPLTLHKHLHIAQALERKPGG